MVMWSGFNGRHQVGVDWWVTKAPTQADPTYKVGWNIQQQTNYSSFSYDGEVRWWGQAGSGSSRKRLSNSDVMVHASGEMTFTASYSAETAFAIGVEGKLWTPNVQDDFSWQTPNGYVPRRPTAAPTAPGTPTTSSTTSSGTTLAWAAPSDMKGTTLKQYEWQVSGASAFGTITKSGTTTARSVAVTGLSLATAYYARVRVIGDGWDQAGRASAYSATASFTTANVAPGTPTACSAVRNSDTQATVSWTKNTASNVGAPTASKIEQSVNGGAFATVANLGNVASGVVATDANRKTVHRVSQSNAVGSSGTITSAAIYTTPAAPTSVAATRSGSDVALSWVNQVAFTEYQTVVQHGTVAAGVTTWDTADLAVLAAGVTSYTHVGPSTAAAHVYRVLARNTTGALTSTAVMSNTVQLIAAPNAPTLADLPNYNAWSDPLTVRWTHNPVDASAQTAFQVQWSSDGFATEAGTTGKIVSGAQSYTFPAGTFAAGTSMGFRVVTWGAATSGGDGTGRSPWSTFDTVAFRTVPQVAILAPAAGAQVNSSTVTVDLAFTQPEGAALVTATIELMDSDGDVIETLTAKTLTALTFTTPVKDDHSYWVGAQVLDSFGSTSVKQFVAFSVDFPMPMGAQLGPVYLDQYGATQLTLSLPGVPGTVSRTNEGLDPADPDWFDGDDTGDAFVFYRWQGAEGSPVAEEVYREAPTCVTLTRSIDGGPPEVLLDRFAWDGSDPINLLDPVPTINGHNLYTATTFTEVGQGSLDVANDVTTTESRWAFLNAGAGFAQVVSFYGDLTLASKPKVESALIQAAGRSRPIALYGQSATLDVSGKATIVVGDGTSVGELEAFILAAHRVCYRDPSGRRMFGLLDASIDSYGAGTAALTYTVSEAD